MKQLILSLVLGLLTVSAAKAQRTITGYFDPSLNSQAVYLGHTSAEWLAENAIQIANGRVPSHVEAYRDDSGPVRFHTVWRPGPGHWWSTFDLNPTDLSYYFNLYVSAGSEVLSFASYLNETGERRYHISFSLPSTNGGYLELGIPHTDLITHVNAADAQNLRVKFMEAYYDEGGTLRYDIVYDPGTGAGAISANMTRAQFDSQRAQYYSAFGMSLRTYESFWAPDASGTLAELYTAIYHNAPTTGTYTLSNPQSVNGFITTLNQQSQSGIAVRCFELRYAGAQPTRTYYGSALAGNNGQAPQQESYGPHFLGRDTDYLVRSNDPGSAAIGLLALGFAPVSVPIFGGQLLVDPVTIVAVVLPASAQWTSVPVLPAIHDPLLDDITIYSQLWQLAPGQQQDFLMSRGMSVTLGRWL